MRRFTWFNATSITLGFAFLYLPIILLVIYSFNDSRLVTVWGGFSTRWYESLWSNRQVGSALVLSLKIAFISATGATILGTMAGIALARFRRDHMGVVFQSFHLIPTMTALENVATPLELAGRRDAFDLARAELETVGLGHRADHYPAQLSGGEQQRVALARASAPRPQILLADEPTGNLDAATGAAIVELLFDLRDRHGATLVLVTHDDQLARRCSRVVRLRDGRIVDEPAREAAE